LINQSGTELDIFIYLLQHLLAAKPHRILLCKLLAHGARPSHAFGRAFLFLYGYEVISSFIASVKNLNFCSNVCLLPDRMLLQK